MSIKLTRVCIIILLCHSFWGLGSALTFLEWGEKCQNPKEGGHELGTLTEECNAGKGLVCNGEACECTYGQRYSYDHVSKECRRKVGKPCQFIDTSKEGGIKDLERLPFNMKCHEYAYCAQLGSLPNTYSGGVVEVDKVSMCICKPGLVSTKGFDACISQPPKLDIVHIPTSKKPKLIFRPAFFTT